MPPDWVAMCCEAPGQRSCTLHDMSEPPGASEPLSDRSSYMVTIETVRAAITYLTQRRIHEHFLGYLYVWSQVGESGGAASVNWGAGSAYRKWLHVPGGPPEKPYFRPISSSVHGNVAQFWMNQNIAGSLAPSSLRKASSFMLGEGRRYALPQMHHHLALEQMLFGEPVEAWAVAAFLLRNARIGVRDEDLLVTTSDSVVRGRHILEQGLAEFLGVHMDAEEYDTIFSRQGPDRFFYIEPLDLLEGSADQG